jgi:Icc-related predicted phosphoesterase
MVVGSNPSKPVMKICAIADSHQHTVAIPPCDVLAIAGDISMDGTLDWFTDTYLPSLLEQQNKFDICLLIFGNHDGKIHVNDKWETVRKTLPPNIIPLINQTITYKGVKFSGSPNCVYFPYFINTFDEKTLQSIYSLIQDNTDVLITHSPPYGIGDTVKGDNYHLGSTSLMERVRQVKPKVHIFGHIHTGKKFTQLNGTKFYNTSVVDENYEVVYKPTIIHI